MQPLKRFLVLLTYRSSILEVTKLLRFNHEHFKVSWLKRQVLHFEKSSCSAEEIVPKLFGKRLKEVLHLKLSKDWIFVHFHKLINEAFQNRNC